MRILWERFQDWLQRSAHEGRSPHSDRCEKHSPHDFDDIRCILCQVEEIEIDRLEGTSCPHKVIFDGKHVSILSIIGSLRKGQSVEKGKIETENVYQFKRDDFMFFAQDARRKLTCIFLTRAKLQRQLDPSCTIDPSYVQTGESHRHPR